MSVKPLIVFVEGNVGAGKTHLMRKMKESKYLDEKTDKKIAYVYEPVDYWLNTKDDNGVNALEHFYSNQEKNSFSFQWLVFMSRMKDISDKIDENYDIIVVERSIFTDKNVFVKALYEHDKMTNIEKKIYDDWFKWVSSLVPMDNIKFIYIKLSTDNCMKRIEKRNREEEKLISYEYLHMLNEQHDDWLCNSGLVLDGMEEDVHKHYDAIGNYILSNN